MDQGPPGSLFGKTFGLVFLAGFSIIAFSMAGGVRHVTSGTDNPIVAGGGWIFSAVPAFLGILGVIAFIGVLVTPRGGRNKPGPIGQSEQSPSRFEADEAATGPRAAASAPPSSIARDALACPGCGTRKNSPGAEACSYCGSVLNSVK